MYAPTVVLMIFLLPTYNVFGHPIKGQEGKKLVHKEEKKYPNGTIVGKYSYKDVDGNPIQVKYYADQSSYGVELKSVKVFGSQPDVLKFSKKLESTPDSSLEVINRANSLLSSNFLKNKSYSPMEPVSTVQKQSNKPKKQNEDYEIFLENDFKPSHKCEKEKVRVYTDKTKRKVRESDNNKFFCERF